MKGPGPLVNCPPESTRDEHLVELQSQIQTANDDPLLVDPDETAEDENRLAAVKSVDLVLGTVLSSSGVKLVNGWFMDWALIELDANRFPTGAGNLASVCYVTPFIHPPILPSMFSSPPKDPRSLCCATRRQMTGD